MDMYINANLPFQTQVVVSLVQALGQSKSSELSNRLLRAMMQFVDQTETTKLLLQSNAWGPILDALITLDPAHPDAVSTAEMGLTIIQKMLRVGKAPPTVMDKVIKVLDIFKGKKSIIDVRTTKDVVAVNITIDPSRHDILRKEVPLWLLCLAPKNSRAALMR